MPSWPYKLIRTFAVLNMVFGVIGIGAVLSFLYGRLWLGRLPLASPYYAETYFFQSGINVLFTLAAIWVGPQLWQFRPRARTICNVLFCGEIAYFCGGVILFVIATVWDGELSVLSNAVESSGATGDVGIVLQLAIGYPLIALIGINLAYRRLRVQPPIAGGG